jgi:hypothetical protein
MDFVLTKEVIVTGTGHMAFVRKMVGCSCNCAASDVNYDICMRIIISMLALQRCCCIICNIVHVCYVRLACNNFRYINSQDSPRPASSSWCTGDAVAANELRTANAQVMRMTFILQPRRANIAASGLLTQ